MRMSGKVVQLHPLIGARIVERVPGLAGLAPGIRHHHERWDGDGYPGGLSGEEIPLEARVLGVADTYSALTSTRPYREPVSPELACEEILRSAGTQFDPHIADLFVKEMRRRGPDEADYGTLAESLDVPAVQAQRERGEPLLGHGSMASTDHVTLLFSHRYLQEAADAEASRAQRRQRPFAVVMVELLTLADINRREGYASGDRALQELGHAVGRALDGVAATPGRLQRPAARRGAARHRPPARHRGRRPCGRGLRRHPSSHPHRRRGLAQRRPRRDVLARARMALDAAATIAD